MRTTKLTILTAILFLVLISFASSSQPQISSCGEITSSGQYYVTQDLHSKGTCLTIKANNVIIDGRGFSISGNMESKDYGIVAQQLSGIEIKNFNLKSLEYGLKLDSLSDSNIHNNRFNNNAYGLKIESSKDSIIKYNSAENNTNGIVIVATSSSDILSNSLVNNKNGLTIKTSSYNQINSNTITNNAAGLYLITSYSNNAQKNTLLGNNEAVLLDSSFYNTLSELKISSCVSGISLENSVNNLFSSGSVDCSKSDVSLSGSSSGNSFLNSYYNISKEFVEAGSKLIRKWDLTIKVIDNETFLPLKNATVNVWNGKGDLVINENSDSHGLISKTEVTDYINNGRRYISYNPYIFYSSLDGYNELSNRTVLIDSSVVVLKLGNLNPPQNPPISNVTVSPNLPLINNGSSQDLLISFAPNRLPLNITFLLYDESATVVDSNTSYFVSENSNLPLSYRIPGGLTNGTYVILAQVNDSETSVNIPVGMFFVIEAARLQPYISDIIVTPALPLTNNGQQQNITIDFTMGDDPVIVRLLIYDNDNNIIYNSSEILVENNSALPIVFTIPALNLQYYRIFLEVKDLNGNNNTIELGSVTAQQPQPQSYGGGGGSYSSRSYSAPNTTVSSTVNLTVPAENFTINNTISFPENNETEKSSFLTGAVIGSFAKKPFTTILIFIIILVAIYIVISGKPSQPPKAPKNPEKEVAK